MLTRSPRRSKLLSVLLATAPLAALIVGCQDSPAPVALNGPGLRTSNEQVSEDFEQRNCDTLVRVAVNDWALTLAPGRVPPAPSFLSGQTFFQDSQVIYGGGVLYGTSPADVVVGYDVAGTSPSSIASGRICVVQTSPVHHTVARLKLATGAAGPAGLRVTQESFAYPHAPDNGYVLLKYTFKNASGTPIVNFYSGWLADWDVLIDGDPGTDGVRYDAGLGLGEATEFDTLSYPQILAIVPVGPTGPFSFAGWGHPADPATTGGYFSFLAGGVNLAVPAEPRDIREMMGLAPLTLAPGQSTVAYFALVGGADRAAFEVNVSAARAKAAALGFCGSGGFGEPRDDQGEGSAQSDGHGSDGRCDR